MLLTHLMYYSRAFILRGALGGLCIGYIGYSSMGTLLFYFSSSKGYMLIHGAHPQHFIISAQGASNIEVSKWANHNLIE